MNLSLGLKTKLIPALSANQISSRYKWLSLELAEPNLGVPPPIDVDPDGTSDVWVLSSDYIGTRGWCSYDPLNFPFNSQERPDIETVGDAVDDVLYTFPTITYIAAINSVVPSTTAYNVLYLEPNRLTTWSPATLSWGTAKFNPLAITTYYLNISGPNATQTQWITGDTNFRSYLHPGLDRSQPYPGFTAAHNTTYAIQLTAEDWANARGTGTFNVYYRAPVIFGISTSQNITEAQILNPAGIIPGFPHNRAPRVNLSNAFDITYSVGPVFYFLAYPQTAYGTVRTTTVTRLPQTTGNSVQHPRQAINLTINGTTVPYFIEVSNRSLNIDTGQTYRVTYT